MVVIPIAKPALSTNIDPTIMLLLVSPYLGQLIFSSHSSSYDMLKKSKEALITNVVKQSSKV